VPPDQFTQDLEDAGPHWGDPGSWTDESDDQDADSYNLEVSREGEAYARERQHVWNNLVRSKGYKLCIDERSRLQRNRALFLAWDVQIPVLTDAYLEFKHPSTPSTYPVAHEFSVTAVDILGEIILHSLHSLF
jgi:hypothetical protein